MNENQWYILGLNFENVGAETSFKIKDLLDSSKLATGMLVAGTEPGNSTQIQIRDANFNAITYFYCNEADYDDDFNPVPGWTTDLGSGITDATLEVGVGFWFKQPTGGGTIGLNFAGQVIPADSADIHVKSIWQLAANPFPTLMAIKNLASNELTAGTEPSNSTQIQIRDANFNAITYFYCNEADYDDDFNPVPGWTTDLGSGITDATIAPGVGFWIKDPSKTFDIEVSLK